MNITNRVIRIHNSKKERQHNDQKNKDNRTNNVLQNIHSIVQRENYLMTIRMQNVNDFIRFRSLYSEGKPSVIWTNANNRSKLRSAKYISKLWIDFLQIKTCPLCNLVTNDALTNQLLHCKSFESQIIWKQKLCLTLKTC